jgi:uncharacterized protein YbjT (DUF2867 family)
LRQFAWLESWLPAISLRGTLHEGRIAMVDARDVAAVAVAALTAPGQAGRPPRTLAAFAAEHAARFRSATSP